MRTRPGFARLLPLAVPIGLAMAMGLAWRGRAATAKRPELRDGAVRAQRARTGTARSDVALPCIDIPAGRRVAFSIPPGWEVVSREPASNWGRFLLYGLQVAQRRSAASRSAVAPRPTLSVELAIRDRGWLSVHGDLDGSRFTTDWGLGGVVQRIVEDDWSPGDDWHLAIRLPGPELYLWIGVSTDARDAALAWPATRAILRSVRLERADWREEFDARGRSVITGGLPPKLRGWHLVSLNFVAGNDALQLAGAKLEGATLEDVDLTGADLTGANLRDARLWGCDLKQADLSGADLSGARINGTRFCEATLTGANLHGAVYDATTQWPSTFDPEAHGARLNPWAGFRLTPGVEEPGARILMKDVGRKFWGLVSVRSPGEPRGPDLRSER